MDVEPDHRHPTGRRSRRHGRVQPEMGQDGPPGHRNYLYRQWPSWGVLPCPGRGPQTGWLGPRLLQRADGPADRRPGTDDARRGYGLAGRPSAPGGRVAVRDLTRPGHLPNLRAGRLPPEPAWLPRQRRGITPQMIGRYPDYDVFDAIDTWDEATTKVVHDRMNVRGTLMFFSPKEGPTLQAFCDIAVAQDAEPKIPVPELIDEKLAAGRLDGYQYADMPDDRDTWHLVLAGLDEIAIARHDGRRFAGLEPR